MPKLVLSVCKRTTLPWMTLDAFYVLVSRVRKFSSLRLLQYDEAGLNDVAGKQHDEYLYAWVRGYDLHGRWQRAQAATALKEVRKVRARAHAQKAAAKAKEKAEKAAAARARREDSKAKAKAARQPNAGPRSQSAAGMRRASSTGRQGNSAGTCQTDTASRDAMQVEPAPLMVPLPQAPAQSCRKRKAPMSVSDLARHGYK